MSTLKTNNIQHVDLADPSILLNSDGSVSIAGTVSYEDATNVDSVGVVTARKQLHVGTGVSIAAGGLNVTAGISTFGANIEIADKIRHNGDDNTAIRFPAADTFTIETAGTERARVDSSGDFGIGMSPSGVRLDVYSSSAADIARFSGPNAAGLTIRNDTSNEIQIHTAPSDALIFGTNGENERARITSDGKVGINRTSPTEMLEVGGSVAMIGGSLKLDTHPLVSTANFTDISGGSYTARLGSTGTSTIRSTQIYGGGGHIATFDGVNTRLGIATVAPNMTLHVLSSTDDVARFQSTNSGNGTAITLDHIGSSPADNDIIGKIVFNGQDDAFNSTTYADIRCITSDVSNGSETAHLDFSTRGYNSFNSIFRLKNRGSASAPSYTADDHNGIILDVYNTGNPYPRYMNIIAKSAGDTDSNIAFWTEAVGGSPTERLRINSAGSMGLGTLGNIDERVHFENAGNITLLVECSTSGGGSNSAVRLKSADSSSDWYIQTGNASTGGLRFYSGAERARIDTDGDFGVGLTNPTGRLHAQDDRATVTDNLKLRNYKSSVNTKPGLVFEASTTAGQGGNSYIRGLCGADAGGSNSNNDSGMEFEVRQGGTGASRIMLSMRSDGEIRQSGVYKQNGTDANNSAFTANCFYAKTFGPSSVGPGSSVTYNTTNGHATGLVHIFVNRNSNAAVNRGVGYGFHLKTTGQANLGSSIYDFTGSGGAPSFTFTQANQGVVFTNNAGYTVTVRGRFELYGSVDG